MGAENHGGFASQRHSGALLPIWEVGRQHWASQGTMAALRRGIGGPQGRGMLTLPLLPGLGGARERPGFQDESWGWPQGNRAWTPGGTWLRSPGGSEDTADPLIPSMGVGKDWSKQPELGRAGQQAHGSEPGLPSAHTLPCCCRRPSRAGREQLAP